jgi:hypothetical protein
VQDLDKVEQELVASLGGVCTGGINWCWYEFTDGDKAKDFLIWLNDNHYQRAEYSKGWREDNKDKHFVRYHR